VGTEERFGLWWTPLLKKRRGRMFQAVGLTLPGGAQAGGEVELWVGSRKYAARVDELLACPDGLGGASAGSAYLFLVPRPGREVRCRAVWKAMATPLGPPLVRGGKGGEI
jgi:hypothetical protein